MEATMATNEATSAEVGLIASKALKNPGSLTEAEIKTLAASALTQRPAQTQATGPNPTSPTGLNPTEPNQNR